MSAPEPQCRYLNAAYPSLSAEDTCADHRHDPQTFALARAIAAVSQQPDPTDEQIGWMMDDAGAVVDDFDPVPETWTVTEPQVCEEPGLDFTLTINGIEYVVQESEWEPSLPVRRDEYRSWLCTCGQAEAERTGHAPRHEDFCEIAAEADQ